MRPLNIVETAYAYPHVCIICGRQNGVEFFVDLGFDIAVLYQPLNEGVVYLCSDHMESLVDQYNRKLEQFRNSNRPVGTYSIREKYFAEQMTLEEVTDGTGSDVSNETGGESGEADRPVELDEPAIDGEDELNSGSDGDAESDASSQTSNSGFSLELL